MIGDVWAVMLKEWRELLYLHTKGGKALWVFALFLCIVLGVVLRRILQPSSVESPVLIAVSTYLSFLPVASIIADSFAGERERHTLETLLASRLSSRSILFGKMLAAIAYGWTVTLLFLALFLAVMNLIFFRSAGLLLYPPGVLYPALIYSLLSAGLGASVGVLTSVRAPSMKEAQQNFFIVIILVMAVPILGFALLAEDAKVRLVEFQATVGLTTIWVIGAGLLGLLEIGLISMAMARFRRSRMLLD